MENHIALSTKKLLPSLILMAKQNSIDICEKEFIAIHPILTEAKYKEIYNYITRQNVVAVFTSANAITPFQSYLHQNKVHYLVNWKIFCLSNQTKKALHPYFPEENLIATAENASELARIIVAHGIKEVVYFCSNKRRDELPDILEKEGVKLNEVVVYETIETPALIKDLPESILFFSPSAVASFFSMNEIKPGTVCFTIGQTTADAIAAYTNNKIVVSENPTQESIVNCLIQYYSKVK